MTTEAPVRENVNETSDVKSEENRPVWSKRLGFVEVSVWARVLNSTVIYNAKPSKSYKDKEGVWKRTDNLDDGDIGNLIVLLQKAQDWILSRK